jgi:hypothetical protein
MGEAKLERPSLWGSHVEKGKVLKVEGLQKVVAVVGLIGQVHQWVVVFLSAHVGRCWTAAGIETFEQIHPGRIRGDAWVRDRDDTYAGAPASKTWPW